MARYFNVAPVTGVVALDDERKGQASFTVANATQASIRGDAVIVPQPGTDKSWFEIDRPSRRWGPGASDQVAVAIAVPADATPGKYEFFLRMLLGGGVPEEQFDDSQLVAFVVEAPPVVDDKPPDPPRKPFPWWIVAVIAAIVAVLVIGGIVVFLATRPTTGTLTVITHVINDNGFTAVAGNFSHQVTGNNPNPASFAGAEAPGVTVTIGAGSYSVSQTRTPAYSATFSADCSGEMRGGETRTCTITNNDRFIILEPIPFPGELPVSPGGP